MHFTSFFYFCLLCVVCTSSPLFGQLDSSNLPLFIIQTKNAVPILDEPKTKATLKIIYDGNKFNRPTDEANIYHGEIDIEIRGKYSASLPQKPYGFETIDSLGENLNTSLFHLPKENDWILLANYNDKTFMRNTLAFELYRQMGHYAPRTKFCEVIVNNAYQGIYVLTEKIKRDANRVAIAKLTPADNEGNDLTGGYIFKVDYFEAGDNWVSSFPPRGQSDRQVHLVYHYPKPTDITISQKEYIKDFVHEFETELYQSNHTSLFPALSDYINEQSFIDYFLVNELARNVDGYKKSSYFHKDKNSKDGLLHAGPVWDFDWAWKNINECYFGATDGSGWAYQINICNPWPSPPGWMVTLLTDSTFAQHVNDRYFQLRETLLSQDYLYNYIDSVATILDEPQKRHFSKWQILGLNVGAPEVDAQPTTYAGEVEKFKTWINRRLIWLDANIPNLIKKTPILMAPKPNFVLYPNPANNQLTFDRWKEVKSMVIYSATGQTIFSINNLENATIDISVLPIGIYVLKADFIDGTEWIGEFLKSND